MTNPLERLKVLKQVNVGQYANLSTYQSFVHMWRYEGLYGFFKGNGVNVLRIAPFSAFEFYFYELYKHKLFDGNSASMLQKFYCGALTGITASTLTYPLDLIRTKLSVNTADSSVKPTVKGVVIELYSNGGIPGLYRGLFSSFTVSKVFTE